ncbi:MAG: glycoside-pentoside-hexuronide (GPH):cation symporter [Planctomycetota bacterium]
MTSTSPAMLNPKPSLAERSGYAVSALSINTYWQLFMMLQLFFYTDIFGISAKQAGTMFLVTRLWDAINDPLVGILADKTRTRWGRYRPWLLWAALPFGVMGVLAFTTPPLDDTGKLIYAYVTYSILGLAYTAIGIPLNAMIGVSSSNSIVRTSLASWNMFGAFVASLFAQLFTLKLVETLGGVEPGMSDAAVIAAKQQGFQYTTLLYSTIAVAALVFAFFVMRERVVEKKREAAVPLLTQAKHLVTCKPWLILLGVFMMMCLFISIRGASAVYYVKYYLGVDGESIDFFGFDLSAGNIIGIYLALGSVGCLIGTPLMAPLAKRFGKRTVFIGMLAVSAVIGALHYPLGRDAMVVALILQTLVGLFSGPLFVLKNAMLADVADQIELKYGHRPTGLVYAAASFGFKFGWTIGGAAAGYALAIYGFEANVEPSERTLDGIVLMMSWLPTVPMALAAILLAIYPLNEKRVEQHAALLEKRRAVENESE